MPVYNGERFLAYALDSVLAQSFRDYELLLVNDGSTDGSDAICTAYADKDARITYLPKRNEGVAVARNMALGEAKGEYVMFVDADDILYEGTLAQIALALQGTKPDILRFEFQTIDESDQPLYPNYEAKKRRQYDGKILEKSAFAEKILRGELYLCMNAFRRSLLEENKIRFLKGCTYCEDILFIIAFLAHCKRCAYLSAVAYGYRKFTGAVTSRFSAKNYQDVLRIFIAISDMHEKSIEPCWRKTLKRTQEDIGLRIYQYLPLYAQQGDRKNIIRLCTEKAERLEWKTYPLLSSALWKPILLWKKIRRRMCL